MIKDSIKALIPDRFLARAVRVKNALTDGGSVKSYSLEGEDMVLRRYFADRRDGFYVDVGAHDPKRFSNTYYFYKRGWRGINIDALPGSSSAFKRLRPRDISIEAAVSDKEETLTYYSFSDPALNGFSDELSAARHADSGYRIIATSEMRTRPLGEILAAHMPSATTINFMSVDVEGLELNVLKSNNWDMYAPEVIVVEALRFSIEKKNESEVYTYLRDLGYELFAKTVVSLLFRRPDPARDASAAT